MDAVLHNYNETIYQRRLLKVYANVVKYPVLQKIEKDVLPLHFIIPETFSMLKWDDYAE